MFSPRVVGEGMGRGNGESVTANTTIMTRRPTNVTETNQYPAFVAYRSSMHVPACLEARVHTHRAAQTHSHVRMHQRQQALFCSPTLGIYVGYAQAYIYLAKIAVHIVWSQHTCNGSMHDPTHVPACMYSRLSRMHTASGVLFNRASVHPSKVSCVVTSMSKEQRSARSWGCKVVGIVCAGTCTTVPRVITRGTVVHVPAQTRRF